MLVNSTISKIQELKMWTFWLFSLVQIEEFIGLIDPINKFEILSVVSKKNIYKEFSNALKNIFYWKQCWQSKKNAKAFMAGVSILIMCSGLEQWQGSNLENVIEIYSL